MSTQPLKYYQFMDNISRNALFAGLVGYGLFPDKLPPIFTSLSWLDFYTNNPNVTYAKGASQYIFYESMRNTNVPRMMGIPNPIAYTLLCKKLKENWLIIRNFFKEQTKDQIIKKSRIHIRRRKNEKSLFQMNYKNELLDGEPEFEYLFDSYYLVKTDIAQCFPSMYSHAIPWALVGKETAKRERGEEKWFNQLDLLTRNIKDGETNGFLIGPHASNLLSEIILCAIDARLSKWRYYRNIDDYTCYVKNQQEAEQFLVELRMALKEFGLNLNLKKTEIKRLPVGQDESWNRKLKDFFALYSNSSISYSQIYSFMELVTELANDNENAAIIYYAMKMVVKHSLTEKARRYYITIIVHLSLIHTYLFPFLDEYLFIPFDVSVITIKKLSDLMLKNGFATKNPESISYSIYFAIKYQFELSSFDSSSILSLSDCVLNVLAWLYANNNGKDLKPYTDLAKKLSTSNDDFERNWIFVYEVLKQNDLRDTWAAMKKHKVSFLLPMESILAKVSPNYELSNMDFSLDCRCDIFNSFFDELWNTYQSSNNPENKTDNYKQYLKLVILNLRIAFANRRNIKIPRTPQYYITHFGEAGESICATLRHIATWLKNNCYAGERLGDPICGYTCYWAKQKLYSRFSEIPTGEVISTQEYNSSVIIKDKSKKVVNIPFSDKALDYKKQLDAINIFFSKQAFSYSPSPQYQEDLYPLLTAIFNNSSWDLGGRLYSTHNRGIAYQDIPSDLRKTIRINGEETVEIDYSGLHISMLYARKNISPPDDPYSFLSSDQRPLAKKAMLIMINASSKKECIKRLEYDKVELCNKQGLSPKKRKLKHAFECCPNIAEIIDLITQKHAAISEFFFSGIGLQLQNLDSLIALEIVGCFCSKGIPVLPVHDSFIIAKSHSAALKEMMQSVFMKYNNGYTCRIK